MRWVGWDIKLIRGEGGENTATEQKPKKQIKAKAKNQLEQGNALLENRSLSAAVKRALKGTIPTEMEKLRQLLTDEGAELTNYNGIALAMVLKALSGDKTAAAWVSDICGEKSLTEENSRAVVVIISGDDEIAE